MSHTRSARTRNRGGHVSWPLRAVAWAVLIPMVAAFIVQRWAAAHAWMPLLFTTTTSVQGRVDLLPPQQEAVGARFAKHVPVDLRNGELRLSVVDVSVASVGMSFQWVRTYTSRSHFDHGHGFNWDFNYNKRITDVSGGTSPRTLACSDGMGREDHYTETSAGSNMFHAPGRFDVIVSLGAGLYQQTMPDGTVCNFTGVSSVESRLASIVDRTQSNTCTIARNLHGNIATVTDSQDRVYTVGYSDTSASQHITSVTDFDGRQVVYGYDSQLDLVSVRSPTVTGTPDDLQNFANGKTTLLTYDTDTTQPLLSHNLSQIIEPLYHSGTVATGKPWLSVKYTGQHNPEHLRFDRVQSVRWGHDQGGSLADPAVSVGGTVTLFYQDNLIGDADAPLSAALRAREDDPNGNRRRLYFDGQGFLRRVVVETNRDVRPGEGQYIEDFQYTSGDGLLTRQVMPRTNAVAYTYDTGNPQRRSQGNLLEVRRQANGVGGGGTDLVTRFTWEPLFNQMRTVTDPRAFPAGTVPLDAGGHLDLGHAAVAQFTTTFLFDYQEGTGVQMARLVPTSERIPEGLGDLNGANDFDDGNVVRIDFPTIQAIGPNSGQVIRATVAHNARGQRLRYTSPDSRVTAYTYFASNGITGDPSDRETYLEKVIRDPDSLALTTTYERDQRGNVTAVLDAKQQRTDFVVNALDQVVRRLSRAVSAGGVRYRTDYLYNANDDLIEVRTENRDEDGLPYPNADLVDQYSFNILHARVRQALERTHNDNFTNAGIVPTHFVYDPNLNLVAVVSPLAVTGQDPANIVTTYVDERDLPFRVIRGDNDINPANTPPATSQVVTLNYNFNGDLIETIDALREAINPNAPDTIFAGSGTGDVHRRILDGFDRLTDEVDPEGNLYRRTYDLASNVVDTRIVGPTGDALAAPIGVLTQATLFWDELNRLVRITRGHFESASGTPILDGASVTTYRWAPDGKLLAVTDDEGVTTTSLFDTADRLVQTIDNLGNDTLYTLDPNGNLLQFDQIDRSTSTGHLTIPDNFATKHTYDGLDRRIRTVSPTGDQWDFGYDSRNNLVKTFDPIRGAGHPNGPGNVRFYEFDGLDRLVRVSRVMTQTGRGDGAPAQTVTTRTVWDDNSRQAGLIDDNGHQTVIVWDNLNRTVKTVYANGTQTLVQWDADGKVRQATDQNGTNQFLAYDGIGRLLGRTVLIPDGNPTIGTRVESYGYDGASRLTKAASDWIGAPGVLRERRFTYDSLGSIGSDQQGPDTLRSAFNGVRNRTRLVYPNSFNPDGSTSPNPRTLDFGYDGLNRLASISEGGQRQVTKEFRGAFRLDQRTYGDLAAPFAVSKATWDGKPRLKEFTHATGAGATARPNAPIEKYRYGWDRLDNLLFEARASQADAGDVYGYDSLYRITANLQNVPLGGVPSGTDILPETFNSPDRFDVAYDGVGSRTQSTQTQGGAPTATSYQQSAGGDAEVNQYSALTTAGTTKNWTWDKNGNLTNDGARRYEYDFRNRLTRITDLASGQEVATYGYDALNARHAKRVGPGAPAGSTSLDFIYDRNRVVSATRTGGGLFRQYLHGSLFQMKDDEGGTYWFFENVHGSIGSIVSSSGIEVESYTYGAFGQTTVTSGSGAVNEYRWLGMRQDPETGLYTADNGTYYDSTTGITLCRTGADSLRNFNTVADNNALWTGGGGPMMWGFSRWLRDYLWWLWNILAGGGCVLFQPDGGGDDGDPNGPGGGGGGAGGGGPGGGGPAGGGAGGGGGGAGGGGGGPPGGGVPGPVDDPKKKGGGKFNPNANPLAGGTRGQSAVDENNPLYWRQIAQKMVEGGTADDISRSLWEKAFPNLTKAGLEEVIADRLWSWSTERTTSEKIRDAFAGAGEGVLNTMSFGTLSTDTIREDWLGIGDPVDRESTAYTASWYAGAAYASAIPVAGTAQVARGGIASVRIPWVARVSARWLPNARGISVGVTRGAARLRAEWHRWGQATGLRKFHYHIDRLLGGRWKIDRLHRPWQQ